ncbi:MAG: DNA polymerase I [Alphaproteobacteria bacterium]|nr:DNA polymerase I [Alphaproteobacteria bacterium]
MSAAKASAAKSKPAAPKAAPGLRKGDRLYLIDGSGYIFRAFHALPPLTRKSDGLPTGAVAGFCNMLFKLMRDTKGDDRPTHLAVVFDSARKNFRNEIYADYKAHRPPPPEDLVPQFPLIREATKAFGVAAVEKEGYEADDLIGAYACQAADAGAHVVIVSSDKDLMQLVVDGKIELLDPVKNKPIRSAEVMEKFGVAPSKVIDVQALAGDSTDNVPGVPGIGVKTAAELINTYGDVETLLKRAGEIKQPKRRETLIANANNARISKKLVTLDCNAPIPAPLSDFAVVEPDPRELVGFLKAMEFNALLNRTAKEWDLTDTSSIPTATVAVTKVGGEAKTEAKGASQVAKPGAVFGRARLLKPIDRALYETVTDEAALRGWLGRIDEEGSVAIAVTTTGVLDIDARITGIALGVRAGEACYIPVGHGQAGGGLDFSAGPKQLPAKRVLEILKPMLEDEATLKIGHDVKRTLHVFMHEGIRLAPIDDAMLLSYSLDEGIRAHDIEELSQAHLQHKVQELSEVIGKGKAQVTFDRVPIAEATAYAAERADVALRLDRLLRPRLAAEHLTTVYETLERPLVKVLADMEHEGILVDRDVLSRLSGRFAQKMAALEDELYKLAGEKFNLGSPKQLGDILFGKFSLPGGRKTKTGAWSTDADVLEELAAQGHQLPRDILEWRQLSKLKSTYTDALPGYINAHTGRIHTCYTMASTSTGRLSSNDPNLQNIPIRTEEGRQIRTAFIAGPGMKLISADYSQIELRLLAHIADIAALKKAFADGVDIHAMTASEMFGVPVKGMPADVRRRAKAINFGIIYGISAFGLANQLSIPRDEANAYIKTYFERFPGIRAYMDRTKALAHEQKFVTTVFGRKVHLPDINASNPSLRAFLERAAINAPIQGSAADIIRRAMIRIPGALKAKKLQAKMLLQVHDELVFEVPEKEVEATSALVQKVMSGAAHPSLELSVPLIVEAKAGKNWDEAH